MGLQSGTDVLIYVLEGFMQRDQHQKNDTIWRLIVPNAHCVIYGEKYLDAGKNSKFLLDEYFQAYGETFSCLRHLAKNSFVPQYVTQEDFTPSNDYSAVNSAEKSMSLIYDMDKIILLPKF